MMCHIWRKSKHVSIEIQHLNVWYGTHQALHAIDLTIASQGITALIGPSGCGKSTLLRCINRMNEEIPGTRVSGNIFVEGVNIYARAIRARYVRHHIGMVFQQPNPLPHASIWENVALGPRMAGLAHGLALREVVERSLRRAALWNEVKDRLQTPAHRLSGGQQQRLCIARALALEPKILLMDEPCSALDPASTLQIEELILEIQKDSTVIIVTHSMQQARRIADTTVFLLQGKLVESGLTSTIFTKPTQQATEDYLTGHFS